MKNDPSADARGAGSVNAGAVEIGADERRDAVRLMEVLTPFHSFLVQDGRDHWVVHARVPGCHGESLDDLLVAIEDWGAGRSVIGHFFLDNQPPTNTRFEMSGERW